MTGETIKSFLVGLNFGIDESSLSKFNKALANATVRVTALYTSINLLAAGVGKAITGISSDFEDLGYEFKILAPAINKALVLRQEMYKAYSATGISLQKAVISAARLNLSISKTKIALEAIYRSVGAKFFPLLTQQSDLFRKKLYENMPRIQDALEKFVKFVFKALEIVTQLGGRLWSILTRVYSFFVKLDEVTGGWSTVILGVIAAWRLLNLSFLATPLGLLLTGFAALLALWDDFKTFKEGGQSLINWGSDTTKTVLGIVGAVAALGAAIAGIILALKAWAVAQGLVNLVMSLNPIGLLIIGITALLGLLTALAVKLGYLKGVGSFFSGFGEKIMDFVGGSPNLGQNIQGNPIGKPLANPVGSNVQNSQVNQNVHQQTSINVMGSADASATGQAVASQQGKVNFDLTRNFKPAAR